MKRDGSEKLSGLTVDDRAALEKAGLRTREEVADRVAREGLRATAGRTVNRDRLREALADYVLDDFRGRTRAPWRRALGSVQRHWLDGVLVALVVLAGAGIVRALGRPQTEVVATRDIAPFQVIRDEDVKVRRGWTDFGTFGSADSVTGRFPLRAIGTGEPLRHDRVSRVRFDPPDQLVGLHILSLPVSSQSAALAVPRSNVLLILTPRAAAGDTAALLRDVLVLDSRTAGDTSVVMVGVSASDLETLGRLLGRSHVVVAQHARTPAR